MKKLKLHQNNPVRIPLILGRFLAVWVIIAVLVVMGSSESFSTMNAATPPGSFSHLVKIANPSVVNISTVKIIKEEREGRCLRSERSNERFL